MKLYIAVLISSMLVAFSGGEKLRGLGIGLDPTDAPVPEPTDAPAPVPTAPEPTDAPAPEPTDAPAPEPTDAPAPEPTDAPAPEPTDAPAPEPTDAPAPEPTDAPVPAPTDAPVPAPTDAPAEDTESPTAAPVSAPTDAPVEEVPTSAPVPIRTVVVDVEITFDGFAPEIGWTITDTDGATIIDVPIGTYPALTTSVAEPVELQSQSTYLFTIRDLFGDGLSNPNEGTYSLSQEGTLLVEGGGDFGREETSEFTTLP